MSDLLSGVLPPLLRAADRYKYLQNEAYWLRVQSLAINPHTVNKSCDQAIVEALAAWFSESDVYPTVVFTIHDDKQTVVAGEYALRAAEWMGYERVFGYHVTGSLRALAFVENIFRQDLDTITRSAEFSEFPEPMRGEICRNLASLARIDFSDLDTIRQVSSLPEHIKSRFRIARPLEEEMS